MIYLSHKPGQSRIIAVQVGGGVTTKGECVCAARCLAGFFFTVRAAMQHYARTTIVDVVLLRLSVYNGELGSYNYTWRFDSERSDDPIHVNKTIPDWSPARRPHF